MNRIEQILKQLTAYENNAYSIKEILPEDKKLEQQLLATVDSITESRRGCVALKTFFEEKHKAGMISSDENCSYIIRCLESLCKKIQQESAGAKGEHEVGHQLMLISRTKKSLSNVALSFDGTLTECDHIVITSSALFIIEVKTTKWNVTIDEEGNYYTQSDKSVQFNKNILEQLNNQEIAVRKILTDNGYTNVPIKKIVVFVNNGLTINNRCEYIEACNKCRVPYIINSYRGDYVISEDSMEKIRNVIRESECDVRCTAEFDFDLSKFKRVFAETVAEIEEKESGEYEKEKDAADSDNTIKTCKKADDPSFAQKVGIIVRRMIKNKAIVSTITTMTSVIVFIGSVFAMKNGNHSMN